MTELVQVPLDKLRPNPDQVRRTFHRIHELAESIAEHGLLQNLVVKPPDGSGCFEIVAGERRYRALTELAKQGRLRTTGISCFVIGTSGTLENIIENVLREDVPLWELGRKYLNLYESGLTQLEIGARIGRTQGHVSTAMILARNLAPAVIVRLSKLPPTAFPAQRLMRLAALLNEEGEPDEETQLRLFQQMLAVPGRKGRRASRTRTEKEAVWDRYQRLKQGKVGLTIDPVYQPFLEAILKYLAGENRGISA